MSGRNASRTTLVRSVLLGIFLTAASFVDDLHASAVDGGPAWQKARSTNFVAAGTISAREMEDLLRRLEAFRMALPQIFPDANVASAIPQQVVFLDSSKQLRALSPPSGSTGRTSDVNGFFLPSPDVNYFVVAPTTGAAATQTLFHEYTHWAIYRSAAGSIPQWVSEGLADLFSTIELSGRMSGASLGAIPVRAEALQAGRWLPLQRLISDEGAAQFMSSPVTAELFYAESWALAHYLLIGQDGIRTEQLQEFLLARASGVPSSDAFEMAFHATPEKLERALKAYLSQPRLPTRSVQLHMVESTATVDVSVMRDWEALRLQGDLLARVGRFDEANRTLIAALAANPAAPETRQALGMLRSSQDRLSDAIAVLEPLAREHPEAFPTQYYLASALAREQEHEQAIVHYELAAAANDNVPSVWLGLSVSQAALDRKTESNDAMERLRALDPDPLWYRVHASAAWRLGDDVAVVRDLTSYVDRVGLENGDGRSAAWLGILAARRSQMGEALRRLLDDARRAAASGSWDSKVVDLLSGAADEAVIFANATSPAQLTEAHAYAGLLAAVDGRAADARTHLEWVRDHCSPASLEYRLVMDELARTARGPRR